MGICILLIVHSQTFSMRCFYLVPLLQDIRTTRTRGYIDNKGAGIYGRQQERKDIRTTRAQGYTDNNEGAKIYGQQRERKDIQTTTRAQRYTNEGDKDIRTKARGCTNKGARLYRRGCKAVQMRAQRYTDKGNKDIQTTTRTQRYTDKGARMYKQGRKDIRTKTTRIYRQQRQQRQRERQEQMAYRTLARG